MVIYRNRQRPELFVYESSQMFLALVGLTALLGAVVVDAETYFEPQGARIVSRRTGPVTGDCWQGELCKQRCLISNDTARFVGSINYVPMCCPFCERSGLYISNSVCNCRHNGPDPPYEPTDEELREVEEFKRRLNGAPSAAGSVTWVAVIIMAALVSLMTQNKLWS